MILRPLFLRVRWILCVFLVPLLAVTVRGFFMQELGFDLFQQIYNLADSGLIDASAVRLVVDVGAFDGGFSEQLRTDNHFPQAQYLCIEANSLMMDRLLAKQLPYVIALIGDQDEKIVDYYKVDTSMSQLETGNSMFREETMYFDNARVEQRQMYTLDTVLNMTHLEQFPVDILKLDIQGAELGALRGARRLIERSPNLLIVTEAALVPYNGPEATSFFELHYEMEKMGFVLVDIMGYSTGKWQVDTSRPPVQIGLQFDCAWMRRERVQWRGKSWPAKSFDAISRSLASMSSSSSSHPSAPSIAELVARRQARLEQASPSPSPPVTADSTAKTPLDDNSHHNDVSQSENSDQSESQTEGNPSSTSSSSSDTVTRAFVPGLM